MASHVQAEPIKTKAYNTSPLPIFKELRIIATTPAQEITPSNQSTKASKSNMSNNL